MKQNLTLAFDSSLLRKIKAFAAERGESISGLLREHFSKLLMEEARYAVFRDRALAQMRKGLQRRGNGPYYADRAELHAR